MDTYWRAQLTIPADTGIPADAVTNTFHFLRNPASGGQTPAQVGALVVSTLQSGYNQVKDHLSQSLKVTDAAIKLYDMEIAPPAAPIWEGPCPIMVNATPNPDLPSEVALVLSYQAGVTAGAVQRRRRGRIYVGPLTDEANAGTGYARPSTALITALTAMGSAIRSTALAGGVLQWCVYSPTTAGGWATGQAGPPNFPAAFHLVTGGWVDNAWDIQRSRGVDPDYRASWS